MKGIAAISFESVNGFGLIGERHYFYDQHAVDEGRQKDAINAYDVLMKQSYQTERDWAKNTTRGLDKIPSVLVVYKTAVSLKLYTIASLPGVRVGSTDRVH